MIVFGFLVVWPAFTWSVLRSPRVQTYLAQHVAAFMSHELGTRVEVGGVNISFFLHIVLEDVAMWDRQGEELVSSRRMVFDVGKFAPRSRVLAINKLSLDDARLALTTYAGEEQMNIQFLLDYFSSDGDRRPPDRSWDVVCKSLELVNADFQMLDQNSPGGKPGFDPRDFKVGKLNLLMTDILLDHKTLSFSLEHMTFEEARGFELKHFSGFLSVGPQGTRIQELMLRSEKSTLSTDLELVYEGYDAFDRFFEDVTVYLNVQPSRIDLADLGYFVSPLYGIEGPVALRGLLSGRPADIRGRDFYLSFGGHTSFRGNLHLAGLPDVENTHVNFLVEDFRTHMDDLASFRLPHTSRHENIQLPENFFTLGEVSFRGRFAGYPTDLTATGTFRTDLGELTTNIDVQREAGSLHLKYKGKLSTPGFELGIFFDIPETIGLISLNGEVEGEGSTLETLDVRINGKIDVFELADYTYENMLVSGFVSNRMFNGSLLVDDNNIFLDFLGVVSFEEDLPAFDFRATVERANLTLLNIYQRNPDAESILSANLQMNASGSTLSLLEGQLDVRSLVYRENGQPEDGEPREHIYATDRVRLSNAVLEGNRRRIVLESEFLDAELSGDITLDGLGLALEGFLADFIPAYLPEAADRTALVREAPVMDFSLKAWLKDTDVLSGLFIPWLGFSPDSRLELAFNSVRNDFSFSGRSDEFTLAGNRFTDWDLEAGRFGNALLLNMSARKLFISDSLFVDHVDLQGTLALNAFLMDSRWDSGDRKSQNHGHLAVQANFPGKRHAVVRVLPSYAMVNDSLWQVNTGNEIHIDSARVEVNNLMVYNNQQMILIDGVFSPEPEDRMRITFREFDFSNLAMFIRARNMDFEGVVNGTMDVTAFYQTPGVEAEINIGDFAFNRERLGDFTIFTLWDHSNDGFMLAAELTDHRGGLDLRPLVVSGYIHPDRRNDNFDLDLLLDDMKLSIWSRYLDGFTPGFHGLASGHLRLEGPFSSPELSGVVTGRDAGFRVDYLNTRYSFSHEVEIGKDFFRFTDLGLRDDQGNTGLASGMIRHTLFKDFDIDLLIRPERMLVLNTNAAHNELYYGRAFASGLIHIHGPEDNITMDISARTNRGTQVFLPLSFSGEVRENNFITFVSRDAPIATQSFPEPRIAGINLNFDLEVTPDAEVQLIFDSQIGDIIRGRGNADLKLEINSLGAFNMYGEYHIEEGDYLFTLQNLINKRFRIEQGGLISWTGDPNDADVDLRASYRLRTSLYDLVMDVDTSDMYRRRVPVDCVLILEDKLFNPTITFDISLPGSDEGTREMIERLITTEQEMNRQVFSLLVLNRFLPTTPDQYNTALGYGVGSTSSELLSNQLSNWLSQISSDFDIGVNYRPGDEISSQELEVALSTQLFDDRVIIDGNLGVAGNHPATTQRASNIIGDVNIEVKITPEGKFRIKAFNRSNTFDVLNTNSPYTQGVGLFYRREFDSLVELFRQQRRMEYPAAEQTEESRLD